MLTLDQIKAHLADRKIEAVAAATNIHRNTIAAIKNGKNENPSYTVMRRLSDYLSGKGID